MEENSALENKTISPQPVLQADETFQNSTAQNNNNVTVKKKSNFPRIILALSIILILILLGIAGLYFFVFNQFSSCSVSWGTLPTEILPNTTYNVSITKGSTKYKWFDVSVFKDLNINPKEQREPGLSGDDWQHPSQVYSLSFNSGSVGNHKLYFYNNDFISYGQTSGTGPKTLCKTILNFTTSKVKEVNIQHPNVNWLKDPQKIQSVGFFSLIDKYYPFELFYMKNNSTSTATLKTNYEPSATYYLVGTVQSGLYKGGSIYLSIVKGLPTSHQDYKGITEEKDIVYDQTNTYLFIKMPDNKFIVTGDYGTYNLFCHGYCNQDQKASWKDPATGILINKDIALDLISTTKFTENLSSMLGLKIYASQTNDFFDKSGLFLVKDLGNNTEFYSNQDINNNLLQMKTVINPIFVIKLPTGLKANITTNVYDNSIVYKKMTSKNYSPYTDSSLINWTADDKPSALTAPISSQSAIVNDYTGISYTSDFDGCSGNLKLDNISSDSETLNLQDNLTEVGTIDKGGTLYEINNKDYKIFQQFWFWKVTSKGNSLSYNDYLALKPILVQKDKLGIYHMMFRTELVSSQCWGEPLIYLYPTQKTDVLIKLSDNINLSESEPQYSNSWNVLAYPDGIIYNNKNGEYYPYLFWEGSTPMLSKPAIQNVVDEAQVHAYFNRQLSIMGLNTKEIKDFENYWESKLVGSPYFLISFYDVNELENVAPLDIYPKPDSLIRILMSYEGLSTKININNTNSYQTPIRNGFTVVEWGGILHRSHQ